MRSITFAQLSLGGAHVADKEARRRLVEVGETVTNHILSGRVSVPVTSVVSLDQVEGCLSQMLQANTTGKIVLRL
jgi:hypothetical protein